MLVLWSGGCDSTLMLYDLCRAYRAKELSRLHASGPDLSDSDKVRAISVYHDQVDEGQKKMEAKARLAIFKEFKRRELTFECLTTHVKNVQGETPGGSRQSAVWLLSATPYLLKDEEMYVGYVAEDDIWHDRESYIKAYNGLQELMSNRGRINFPLEWEYKLDVVNRLEREKLLELTWWCEHPKKRKPCGRCKSCYRMEAAFHLQKLHAKRDLIKTK